MKKLDKKTVDRLRQSYLAGEGSIAVLIKKMNIDANINTVHSISKKEGWVKQKKELNKFQQNVTKNRLTIEVKQNAIESARIFRTSNKPY